MSNLLPQMKTLVTAVFLICLFYRGNEKFVFHVLRRVSRVSIYI